MTTKTATKPETYLSGFCSPGHPPSSHRLCPGEYDGRPCRCDHHVVEPTPDLECSIVGTNVPMVKVAAEVLRERVRQDARWGEQNHADGTGPTIPTLNAADQARHECDYAHRNGVGMWRHILAEEYAEAMAESDPAKLRAELIQIAAVAAAWVAAIDRRERAS